MSRFQQRLVCAGLLAFVLLATVWGIAVQPQPDSSAKVCHPWNPTCQTPGPTASPVPTSTIAPTPIPTPAPTLPPGTTCPSGQVFLEAQSWWKDDIRLSDAFGEHTHVGTCFPWGGHVSGTLTFNVRILLHNNPGDLLRIQPQVWYAGGSYQADQVDFTADGCMLNCEVWTTVTVDTTRAPVDGWQELRFFTQVRHVNGDEQHTSTGWQLYFENGNPVSSYRGSQGDRFTEGRGWYTGTGYTVGRYSSPYFLTARSGTWTFNVDLKEGAGGTPVTFSAVYIDPDFHNGSSGTTVRSSSGSYIGPVSITTTTLANGPHKLVLRADTQTALGRSSGLQVIPFTVSN
jgi:hypothetical protein